MAHDQKSLAALEERKRRVKSKILVQLDLGLCPVCGEKLVDNWNKQKTHKYEECPVSPPHHRKLIDYVKDED